MSGTDEEGAEPVTADSLIFLGNPIIDFLDDNDPHAEAKKKPKKKRGGQRKIGRARQTKPLYFEPSLFQDPQLLEEFKQRVKFTNHDFNTFFTDTELQVCPCLS